MLAISWRRLFLAAYTLWANMVVVAVLRDSLCCVIAALCGMQTVYVV